MEGRELYMDGGYIFDGQLGRSSLGLVWAWRQVNTGRALDEIKGEAAGVFSAHDLSVLTDGWLTSVTSTMAETYAMMVALEQLPAVKGEDGVLRPWTGKICCDNLNLINACRQMHEDVDGFDGAGARIRLESYLPKEWVDRLCKSLCFYLGKEVEWVHLKGHPGPADLARGCDKYGTPVSRHNRWCDEACNKAKTVWLSEEGVTLDKTKARGEFCAVRSK